MPPHTAVATERDERKRLEAATATEDKNVPKRNG